jgi:hypothetical protein
VLTENVSIDLYDVNKGDKLTVGGAVHLWLTFLHQAIRLRNAYFAMLQRPRAILPQARVWPGRAGTCKT